MTAVRIAFVGDSVTLGVGDERGVGWPDRLRERARRGGHDVTNYNLGVRSDTSEHIAARWKAECTARLPTTVPRAIIFSFGLNDATCVNGAFRVPLKRSVFIVRAMLSEAASMCPVLWVGPTAIDGATQPLLSSLGILQTKSNDATAGYDACYQTIARDLGIPYLPLLRKLSSHRPWTSMLTDGVHPSANGYDLIADEVEEWAAWRNLFGRATKTNHEGYGITP